MNTDAAVEAKKRALLRELLTSVFYDGADGWFPERHRFRAAHKDDAELHGQLEDEGKLRTISKRSVCTMAGLRAMGDFELAKRELRACTAARTALDEHFTQHERGELPISYLASHIGGPPNQRQAQRVAVYLEQLGVLGVVSSAADGAPELLVVTEGIWRLTDDLILSDPKPQVAPPVVRAPASAKPEASRAPAPPKGDFGRWKRVNAATQQGGQGDIFEVVDARGELPGRFALKRLKNVGNPARVARFKQETEVLAKLNHPRIVPVIDADLTAARPWFVMPWFEGGNIESLLPELMRDPALALRIFAEICDGVAAAHAATPPIVHRDLKPANVLLSADRSPAVADFGICHVKDDDGERLTETSEVMGPRWFCAPELRDGRAEPAAITPRCDVYSLGKLLHRMLGGRVFDREDHRKGDHDLAVRNEALEHVNRLLDRMIVFEADGRLADAGAVAVAVRDVIPLVAGAFRVVRSGGGQRCLFCGEGRYYTRPHEEGTGASFFGAAGMNIRDGRAWRILVCDACGHVQTFRIEGTKRRDDWDA